MAHSLTQHITYDFTREPNTAALVQIQVISFTHLIGAFGGQGLMASYATMGWLELLNLFETQPQLFQNSADFVLAYDVSLAVNLCMQTLKAIGLSINSYVYLNERV